MRLVTSSKDCDSPELVSHPLTQLNLEKSQAMDPKNRKKETHATCLKQSMARLPYVTSGLPGVGGVLKSIPEHFQVDEILPYSPCGDGEHVFVRVKRQGWNTADVARTLGKPFGLKGPTIGWGGRKDKQAVTTQTFSLHLPMTVGLAEIRSRLEDLPFQIIDVQRHRNKLKTGHVAGNRFCIVLSGVGPEALAPALAVAHDLKQCGGIPNYFGPQRFGAAMANIDRAMGLLSRPRAARGRKGTFMVSALQSALFNFWLAERIRSNTFNTILQGDVAQKTDTGGLFVIDDVVEAMVRFNQGAIVYTGPIYGHKMMPAARQAGEFEADVLETFDLTPQTFKPLRAPGTRRAALLRLPDLVIEAHADGLQFCFTLPSGAYATTVMREFMRPPLPPEAT